ncbi:MAG: HU family DNA-binding protein [bacterium]|nr:HU family DNA-binding protein [bacterium]
MAKPDKKWLAELVTNHIGGTKKQGQEVVDLVFDNIAKMMVKGEQVKVAGFGVFKVSRRAAREGINPRTQEKIQIAAKVAPKFRAAKQLKEMVQ